MTLEQHATLRESKQILAGTRTLDFSEPVGKGYSSRHVETLWEATKLRDAKMLLDVGFSLSSLETLGMLLEAKKYLDRFEAVDIIPPARVKTRYPNEWVEEILQVPLTVGDVRSIALPHEAFDTISCISTIEHIGYDAPSKTSPQSAFERTTLKEGVQLVRDGQVDRDVFAAFRQALMPGGRVLVTVPMGKGGPVVLQDSLGLYCVEWEYEQYTWTALTQSEGFMLGEELFFKNTPTGWIQVRAPADLADVTETIDAKGVGLALAVLVKR